MIQTPLAHSPKGVVPAQSYSKHVNEVVLGACANVAACSVPGSLLRRDLHAVVRAAAEVHDLGKLDPDNQDILGKVSNKPLPIRHEDAGVAHLKSAGLLYAAALVAGHHQGLHEETDERDKEQRNEGHYLRIDGAYNRTQARLPDYLVGHRQVRPNLLETFETGLLSNGFAERVALSCLVDADHGDTARNYQREPEIPAIPTHWGERRGALRAHVASIEKDEKRGPLRDRFFAESDTRDPTPKVLACDAPVGSGKTLSVMAHLLKAAEAKDLRHILVVLPFTNIVKQSVDAYRKALSLPGEDPTQIVAEHHHQSDFSSIEHRHLATLWKAPITVTTSVQFFETLASHHPAKLRKLHALPCSAVFLDETHACLPPHLWRLAWQWLQDWVQNWRGHLVLGSGSLPRFWTSTDFVDHPVEDIPNLVSEELRTDMNRQERARIAPRVIGDPLSLKTLVELVGSTKGPRLVVLNTVHSAAVLAKEMSEAGLDVMHISTALTPLDRGRIFEQIRFRLRNITDEDWTVVSTSCIEAGVDFSFRTAIREGASTTSLIQVGGRVRRHFESWTGELLSVTLADVKFRANPGLNNSRDVLSDLLAEGAFHSMDTTELILESWRRELKQGDRDRSGELVRQERYCNHRTVAERFKVIEADTRFVVISNGIAEALRGGVKVSAREVLLNSCQIWATKLERMPIVRLNLPGDRNSRELYEWVGSYDPDFLGYMDGALTSSDFMASGGAVV